MRIDQASRRMFLRGAGGCALAVPFLSSLVDEPVAKADEFSEKPCFLYIYSPNGALMPDNWYPSGNPSQTEELYPGHVIRHDTWERLLGAGGRLSPVLEGLEDQIGKMNLIRGLDVPNRIGHNSGIGLGYQSRGSLPLSLDYRATIDQVMAESESFYDVPPDIRTLLISYFGGSVSRPVRPIMTEGGNYQVLSRNVRAASPRSLFDLAFLGREAPDTEEPRTDPRARLVDHAIEDYRRIRDHRALSREDRDLLTGHMELFTDLQTKLDMPPASCEFPDETATLAQVIAAVYRCRISRLGTINTVEFQGTARSAWHGWSHSWWEAASQEGLVDVNRRIANDLFKELVVEFDRLPEANGRSLLDNSLIYWSHEHSEMHDNANLPILTAGEAGGKINTGNYIDYRNLDRTFVGSYRSEDNDDNLSPGILHNRWLATCLQAMGMSPSDYEESPRDGYSHALRVGSEADTVNALYAQDYPNRGEPVPVLWNG